VNADTVFYTLDNVTLADNTQMTGTFSWTYDVGDFENGVGQFTFLEIPWTSHDHTDLDAAFDIGGSIEITLEGSVHDDGVDITLALAQPLTPTTSSLLVLGPGESKYEIGGNGFHDGLFQSGSISPILEPENLPDPLLGGTPIDGLPGWFFSEWFGAYNTTQAPWLFHAQHGFIYRYPESTNASLFIYDDAMGAWWWTNESVYPSLYVFNPPADLGGTQIGSEWLWFFEGANGPRWFSVLMGDSAGSFLSFDP
jgi:hypothetical protein